MEITGHHTSHKALSVQQTAICLKDKESHTCSELTNKQGRGLASRMPALATLCQAEQHLGLQRQWDPWAQGLAWLAVVVMGYRGPGPSSVVCSVFIVNTRLYFPLI